MVKIVDKKHNELTKNNIEDTLLNFDFDICVHIPISKLKEYGFILRDLNFIEKQKEDKNI